MTDTVTVSVTYVISGRTTHVIAAEINLIKYQAERIYLASAVEIGRRLTEAKTLLKYGEWGKWLEESVDFSQSRANKLMRLQRVRSRTAYLLKFGSESEFELQPGGASFRDPKGGTGTNSSSIWISRK